jgi:3-oxoacyl-ACP reductase-like protein
LLLAGGTGLAPFTAMLEKIAEQGSEHPLHLIYGVTNDFDLVELDRLQALAARIPNFTYSACVANPDSQYPQKGYVTQHIEPRHLNDGDVDVYLCGPPPMVEAVSQYIREQGITPANFYYEKSPRRPEAFTGLPASCDTAPVGAVCPRRGSGSASCLVGRLRGQARSHGAGKRSRCMNNRFHNKVALVTGAAQGIGRAVCWRLKAEGAQVVAVDRSELVHELAGEGMLTLTADLEQHDDCAKVMARAVEPSAASTS